MGEARRRLAMGTMTPTARTVSLSRHARIALHNFVASIGPGNAQKAPNLCGLKHLDMDALRATDRVLRTIDVESFGSVVTAETQATVEDVDFAEGDLRWLVERLRGCTSWSSAALATVIVPIMDMLETALERPRGAHAGSNGEAAETRAE
jgi:hypothetical protein